MVLTEKGFKRPAYEDLLTMQIERARNLFGEDIDTSEQAVLGKYLRISVNDLAECYELLEDIYYARFPNSARGQSLDRLCAFAGVVRDPAIAARIKVLFQGKTGTVIPAAFLVSGAGRTFYTNRDYAIGEDGTGTAYLNCTDAGPAGNLPSGTELTIVNPNADLESVKLIETAVFGQAAESDTALRLRFNKSVAGSGSATIDALRGAISRVPLVDGVAIIENDTEEPSNGRPPHSFECYVLAPESQDRMIAEAIFSKKPLGIKCIGDVSMEVRDEGGRPHTIRFSRTIQKNLQIRGKILTNQYFESDGIEQIRDQLMEYINNLANGESVYASSLYGYIHHIHGVVNVQSLTVSTDGTEAVSGFIRVEDYEIARISPDQIEIEVIK